MKELTQGYKQTKVGVIPDSWEVVRLGEIAPNISYGLTVRPSYIEFGIPLISASEIKNGIIDYINAPKISQNDFNKLSQKAKAQKGDIFLSKTGTIGKVAYVLKDTLIAITQNIAIIRIDNNKTSHHFVLQYLITDKFQKSAIQKVNQSTIMDLQLQDIKKLFIPLPSIKEQKKIAKILTTYDDAISKQNELIKAKEELKKGLMQKLLNGEVRFCEFNDEWKSIKLEDITKIYDGTHFTPKYTKEGIPFYSVEHLTKNNFKDTKYIAKDVFLKENKRVKLETNDILMTKIGDIGTSKLINWDVNASFYVTLALIKQSNSFNSSFLNFTINASYFQRQLHSRTLHIAFPKKINLGEIGKCFVQLPSLQEQQKIAEVLSNADKEIGLLKNELQELKEQKKGLMQKLLTGEVRVTI